MDDVRLIEQDDPGPFCALCGRDAMPPGDLCEECRAEDLTPYSEFETDYCHCGLAEEDHAYPTVDHAFKSKA